MTRPAERFEIPAWETGCIERARRGDVEAFAMVYDAYAARLYERVLMPLLLSPAAAEDALSETFRAAFQAMPRYEPSGSSIYFWLARISRNKALDQHRARLARGRLARAWQRLALPLFDAETAPDLGFEAGDEARRLSDAVRATLLGLNDRYREVLELRFLQDRSRQQCAEHFGVTLGTFDVLLLRALAAFKKRWETSEQGQELPEVRAS